MENLENIIVTGEISLQPYKSVMCADSMVLILGPTGAGKSSFVEALAGPSQKLSLSSDQLAGYTQHISAFRVVNARLRGGSITLVDTPGFSDSKFSEKEILDMVKAWLNKDRVTAVRILFLVPINGTRLPGTKRRTMEMLQTFLKSSGKEQLTHLTFVTTMWDTLYSEGALSRGQSNFEQLRKKQLKYLIDDGAKIVKFRNTLPSAIQVLDACLVYGKYTRFHYLQFRTPQLYRDLYERIENALLEKRNIEDDLAQPEVQMNLELRNILQRKFSENDEILTKFIRQFNDYGDPPQGLEDAAKRLRQEIDIVTNRPRLTLSIVQKVSIESDVNTPVQSPSIRVGDQILQTLSSVDPIEPLVVKSEPRQPERTLTPIIKPERSTPTQSILPKASTELDVITQVHSSSVHMGDPTFPVVDATKTSVLELERRQLSGPTSITTVITPKRHSSFGASLKEIPRRTLEGMTRPWKKWFGPKH